jgi:hypothetical protein
VPTGLTSVMGTLVASGRAVGLAVVLPDDDEPVVGWGAAVGESVVDPELLGVEVTEDPQANSKATNKRTITLGN